MLLLIMEVGGARYGVPASQIVEVVPVPVLRPLPGTPPFVVGVFNYHGSIVPVVDLSSLLTDHPARLLLSTRVLLVRFRPLRPTGPVLLGFLAEHATEIVECTRQEFQPAGVKGNKAPYAGDILIRPNGFIQELKVDNVLTAELQEQLFAGAPAPI